MCKKYNRLTIDEKKRALAFIEGINCIKLSEREKEVLCIASEIIEHDIKSMKSAR